MAPDDRRSVVIGLVGDFDESVPAHQAIPFALKLAGEATAVDVGHQWIPTEEILSVSRVSGFDGLWCVPASPYRSMEGALLAIRYARETGKPFLGTCGGFQHAVIEYARDVLGWSDADHAESSPDASRAVISPLACGLLADEGTIRLLPGTRVADAYGSHQTRESYLCRYGLDPAFRSSLISGPLQVTAEDESGDVRAIELAGDVFFVATLFQPERRALRGQHSPLVAAFIRACSA